MSEIVRPPHHPYVVATQAYGFSTMSLPDGTGYVWTLTSRLGDFINEIETKYGSRDRDYTLLGIEFCGEIPRIWFPGGDRKHISVMLTDSARSNSALATFQMAHEAIHLLAPVTTPPAIVAEEGLATLFSYEVSTRLELDITIDNIAYVRAMNIVKSWIEMDPNAVQRVRQHQPNFDLWTPNLICERVPNTSSGLAELLCTRFDCS